MSVIFYERPRTWTTLWGSFKDQTVLNTAGDKLYAFMNIDYVKIFVSFNSADGTLVGDRFLSNNGLNCNEQYVDSIALNINKVYVSYYCIKRGLLVYDISLNSFSESYEYTSSNSDMSKFIIFNNILFYFGWNKSTNNAVVSSAALSSLAYISNITSSSFEMNKIINSDYSFSSTSISDNMATSTINLFSYTPSTKVVNIKSYINSDIVSHTTTESFMSLRENDKNTVKTILQTWSKSGNINFKISIVQNGVDLIPSWVSDDSTSMQLKMNTPSVNSDSSYSFKIQTKYGNLYSDQKIINLKVLNWLVENWDLCENDPSFWQIWSSEYLLSTDRNSWELINLVGKSNSIETNDAISIAEIATQIAIGASVAMGSTNSAQSIWASINQFQLYLLVPMLGIYIDLNVLSFLKGFSFAIFSYSFTKIEKIKFVSEALSIFPEELNTEYLSDIGITHIPSIYKIYLF